jgi:hypothetical protein
MACVVMKGLHHRGEKSRRCGFFKDGNLIQKVEIVGLRILVTDPLNRVYYESEALPELVNYAVQQIGAVRSAQSGKLVVSIGGFYAGDDGMQSMVIATDYPVREPVEYAG